MVTTGLRLKELLRQRRWTTKVLAEKTGMSESYLTHIKNGTRRWNEDALKKIAMAFEMAPTDFFVQERPRTDAIEHKIKGTEQVPNGHSIKVVPVVGKLPSEPTPYNNQLMQQQTGHSSSFVPVLNIVDPNVFCYVVSDESMASTFKKGDLLVISPEAWTRSGTIAAVEYTANGTTVRAIKKITYMDEFIVLDAVNHAHPPVPLVRGKDHFRVIGKVLYRYQAFSSEGA